MNTLFHRAALGAAILLAAGSAWAGTATVTYLQPELFSDVPRSSWERERTLKELSAHFDKLAARLPPGQDLKVEVLDVDLAGHIWPGRFSTHELRILNGRADWPHIKLRYTITQGGQVVRSGEETLSDMNYLGRMQHYIGDQSLRYEKQMLDDWFKEKIIAAR